MAFKNWPNDRRQFHARTRALALESWPDEKQMTATLAERYMHSYFELLWNGRSDYASVREVFVSQTLASLRTLYGASYEKMVLRIYDELNAASRSSFPHEDLKQLFIDEIEKKSKLPTLEQIKESIRQAIIERFTAVSDDTEFRKIVAAVIGGSWGSNSARADSDLDLLWIWDKPMLQDHPVFRDLNVEVQKRLQIRVDHDFQLVFDTDWAMNSPMLPQELSKYTYAVAGITPEIEEHLISMKKNKRKKTIKT